VSIGGSPTLVLFLRRWEDGLVRRFPSGRLDAATGAAAAPTAPGPGVEPPLFRGLVGRADARRRASHDHVCAAIDNDDNDDNDNDDDNDDND
jgi:hypothetical protein